MTRQDVAELVVRMAVDNPRWGYTRIRGALSNLGHTIARTTVKRILHDHGVDPAPERSRHMPWKTFLQAHWEGLAACDLFTVEVLTLAGLRRYLVFFVIELRSRHVTIAGIHPQPGGAWMEQQARNVTDPVDGCLRRARHLIHDRDPLYTRVFGEILESAGVQPIRLPPDWLNIATCQDLAKDPRVEGIEPDDVRLPRRAHLAKVAQPSVAAEVDAVEAVSPPPRAVSSSADDGRPLRHRRVAKPSAEEPDAAEPARPDLWGAGVSNDPGLPDVRQAWRAAPCLALSTGRRKPTGK